MLKYMSPRKFLVSGEKCLQTSMLVLLLECDMHGYEIAQKLQDLKLFRGRLEESTSGKVGGVYANLRKMEMNGLIMSTWNTEGPKKPRRVYSITHQGRSRLDELIADMGVDVASLLDLIEMYKILVASA